MPVLAILALLHLYIGWRIAAHLPGWAAALFIATLLASAALIPMAFAGRRMSNRTAADRWTWLGMLALGAFSMLLVSTLLRDAVLLLGRLIAGFHAMPPLAAPTALAVPLLAAAGVAIGIGGARRTARVREVQVPIAGLPAALDGFTLVQISDLHVGPTVKRGYVQRIVDAANRLDADAVAITGDLVDGRVDELRDDVSPLAALHSHHGTFFVTGNHEYYSGAGAWTAHLRGLGVRVLNNEHVVIERGGAGLVLAGVTDYSAGHFAPAERSDPQRAIAGAPADAAVRVLLAHQPRSAPAAAEDRLGSMWVYTSRGTGYLGPPMRLGAPSEITRLRLVARPSSAGELRP